MFFKSVACGLMPGTHMFLQIIETDQCNRWSRLTEFKDRFCKRYSHVAMSVTLSVLKTMIRLSLLPFVL